MFFPKNVNYPKCSKISFFSDLTLAKCSTEQLLLLHKERKFLDQTGVRIHFGGVISRTIIDVLLQGIGFI